MKKSILIIAIAFNLFACNKPAELKGFDMKRWQEDKNGCNNYRSTQAANVMSQKDKLIGLSQEEVKLTLGAFDRNELMERGQKQLVYFVSSGDQCDGDTTFKKGTALYLRFDALNNLYEITMR